VPDTSPTECHQNQQFLTFSKTEGPLQGLRSLSFSKAEASPRARIPSFSKAEASFS